MLKVSTIETKKPSTKSEIYTNKSRTSDCYDIYSKPSAVFFLLYCPLDPLLHVLILILLLQPTVLYY